MRITDTYMNQDFTYRARIASAVSVAQNYVARSIEYREVNGTFPDDPSDLGYETNGAPFPLSTNFDLPYGDSTQVGVYPLADAACFDTASEISFDLAAQPPYDSWSGSFTFLVYKLANRAYQTECIYQYCEDFPDCNFSGTDENLISGCVNMNTTSSWDGNNYFTNANRPDFELITASYACDFSVLSND